MPPRVRGAASPLAAAVEAPLQQSSRQAPFARTFTTTPRTEKITKRRFEMHQFLKRNLERFDNRGIMYLTENPFPNNTLFKSQPVLSTYMKDAIYTKVVEKGESLKSVSAEMGVDVRRVAAVVRLAEVQKQWVSQGKKLAIPYSKAVMKMLPHTPWEEGGENQPHEPINDIHVHNLTLPQLFIPTSESAHFTRQDAARAFSDKMLSVDARSPQQSLIHTEKSIVKGTPVKQAMAKFKETSAAEEDWHAKKLMEEAKKDESNVRRVKTDRYEFRFTQFDSSDVGRDGKKPDTVGWRYGAPLTDRKRGAIKIPTSVP